MHDVTRDLEELIRVVSDRQVGARQSRLQTPHARIEVFHLFLVRHDLVALLQRPRLHRNPAVGGLHNHRPLRCARRRGRGVGSGARPRRRSEERGESSVGAGVGSPLPWFACRRFHPAAATGQPHSLKIGIAPRRFGGSERCGRGGRRVGRGCRGGATALLTGCAAPARPSRPQPRRQSSGNLGSSWAYLFQSLHL